jgi:hypothetical protein
MSRKPLDQARISRILGSTTQPAEADVVGRYVRNKGGPNAGREAVEAVHPRACIYLRTRLPGDKYVVLREYSRDGGRLVMLRLAERLPGPGGNGVR